MESMPTARSARSTTVRRPVGEGSVPLTSIDGLVSLGIQLDDRARRQANELRPTPCARGRAAATRTVMPAATARRRRQQPLGPPAERGAEHLLAA